jgi:hypothetical protein
MTATTRPPQPNDRPVIYYTATIITLDGSDTNAYCEPCEPGQGYSEQSGHWDPDRSYWRVHDSRDDVRPDVYPNQSEQAPAQWLADQLGERLGNIDSYDHGHTFYAAHEAVHPGTLADAQGPGGELLSTIRMTLARGGATKGQRTLTAAGHAYGFSDDELIEAAALLGIADLSSRQAKRSDTR